MTRRTQEERSAATRARLLDATITCLVERGYGGTTTTAVAEQAGVSRGAQLHHFGTRQALVAAAVTHLAEQRAATLRAEAAALPATVDRPRRVLGSLAEMLSGPLYAATIELWVAARADADLHALLVEVEARLVADLRAVCREHLTDDPVLVQLTLDLLLGRGVSGLLSPWPAAAQRRALDTWAELLARTAPTRPMRSTA